MAQYTTQEQLEFVLLYGECNRDASLAARTYARRFPNRRHPDHRVISRTVVRLGEIGSFAARHRAGRPAALDVDQEQAVMDMVAQNPHVGTRGIGQVLGACHTTIWRMLRAHHYHPFRVHLHQALQGNDMQRRVDFSNWMLIQTERDVDFLRNVMASDEATFYRDGTVNRHNMHYWSPVNPHWLRSDDHQTNWRVNVWCGIHGDRVVGPVFLDGTLNAQRYEHLLETVVATYLDDMPLARLREYWFQQDGAPPHYGVNVRWWLDEHFPGRWIGRGGPVSWPARSPDLTPLDFFFWGYVKSVVYDVESTSLDHLRERIRLACATVTPEILAAVRRTWLQRLRDCIIANGETFEHFY